MQYLCNKHGLDELYPADPARRAMVDSAMFYLIGTLYPLLARATYPALGFPQYPGEVGTSAADDDMKARAQQDAAHNTENGRICANRQRQSRDHQQRERRTIPEAPHRIAAIGPHKF